MVSALRWLGAPGAPLARVLVSTTALLSLAGGYSVPVSVASALDEGATASAVAAVDDDVPADAIIESGSGLEGTEPLEEATSAEAEALAEAAQTGAPVEVVAKRGETREFWALPDGSIEAREFVSPKWTRTEDGWAELDLDLVEAPSGVVAPVASTVDVEFSGGGDDPLVQMTRAGRVLEWTWPAPLPEPVLDGDTATYGEVLAGVDLRMTAVPDGFSSSLVVKTAEAAASPELDAVTFEMETQGLEVDVTENSVLEVRDTASDALVFEAAPASMWSTVPVADAGAKGSASRTALAATETDDAPAADVAPVGVTVSPDGNALTLTPDQEMLSSPDTTFPVVIDPQVKTPRAGGWTSPNKVWPTQSYWLFKGDSTAGLGTCAGWANCPDGSTYRLIYQFDTAAFLGKEILDAEFVVRNTHSAVCEDHRVDLWRTKAINSATTWNTQTASGFWTEEVGSATFSYGGSQSGCKPAADAEFGLTSYMQRVADNGTSKSVAFGMRAGSETDKDYWKKFSQMGFLRVTYNSTPNVVKLGHMALTFGGSCSGSSIDTPLRTGKLGLMRVAYATDPDPSERITLQYRLERADGTQFWTGTTVEKVKQSPFALSMPTNMPQNARIQWSVRVYDGHRYSAWSERCQFVYDTSMPAPPVITAPEYPEPDPSDPNAMPNDGVGEYGWFTVESPSHDVVRYQYHFNDDPYKTVEGSTLKIAYLPLESGPHQLVAKAIDGANNDAQTTYTFWVAPGRDQVGNWTFDEPVEGEPVPTSYTTGGNASVTDPGSDASLQDSLLQVDGDGDYAFSTTGRVNTSTHFAVEAWVKPRSSTPTGVQMVAAQAGALKQGFMLYYSAAQGGWNFGTHETDTASGANVRVTSNQPYQAGKWTHLLGVYDAYRDKLILYVNGIKSEADWGSPWNATGDVYIGAGKYGPDALSNFDGQIDQVRTYDRVVTETEAAKLSYIPPAVVARWNFEDAQFDPTVGFDNVATTKTAAEGDPLVLTLPATGAEQSLEANVDTFGLKLDGQGGYGATGLDALSSLKPTDSFTLSAFVRTAGVLPEGGSATALSWTGSVEEAIQVRAVGYKSPEQEDVVRWELVVREGNTVSSPRVIVRNENQPFGTDWTHLAVVYDAPTRTATLYVGGAAADENRSTGTASFESVRRFNVGRGLSDGVWENYWPGLIDDAWVFRGALSESQIDQLSTATSGLSTEVPGALR
ncbi:LamG domain-containing protein [Promicromonospora sp. NPDC059942]|uniref:LamG domain-containing protein n=1 Tax=Promicromonospora sp. NPDC059942 TaxID=3347009 RepID=UPI00365AA00D